MKTKNNILWAIVAIVAIAVVVVLPYKKKQAALAPTSDNSTNPPTEQPIATTTFACDNNKSIEASFYTGTPSTTPVVPGQPPVPTGSVDLKLSDGSNMTLAQTLSADGSRYANADESIIFWNVGNKVTFTENGKSDYNNCVATQ